MLTGLVAVLVGALGAGTGTVLTGHLLPGPPDVVGFSTDLTVPAPPDWVSATPRAATSSAPARPPAPPTTAPTTTTTSSTTSAPPATSAEPPAPSTSPPSSRSRANPGAEQQVVDLVNEARADAGCSALDIDARLTRAAQGHSTDMSDNDYFSHTSQDGRTFVDRVKAAGYPSPGAENIAMGQRSPEDVMDAWMNSDGHRENILNCDLQAIGVGLDTAGWYWTQDFGR